MLKITARFVCGMLLILAVVVAAMSVQAAIHKTRVDIPYGYKACSRDIDCVPISVDCEGSSECCQYDAISQYRQDDYRAMNKKECGPQLDKPMVCTICEPISSHIPGCVKGVCQLTDAK